MTTHTDLPAPGCIARFDLDSGDSYLGEVTAVHSSTIASSRTTVTLRNYSAWYEGDSSPYSSPYFDDEVTFLIDSKSVIDVQVAA